MPAYPAPLNLSNPVLSITGLTPAVSRAVQLLALDLGWVWITTLLLHGERAGLHRASLYRSDAPTLTFRRYYPPLEGRSIICIDTPSPEFNQITAPVPLAELVTWLSHRPVA